MFSKIFLNKKVLLRERKRHTARRVASPRGGGGGIPTLAGVVPTLAWAGGVPTLAGGAGVPTLARVSPPQVWTYKQTEPITFPHPTDAGSKNPRNRKYIQDVLMIENYVFLTCVINASQFEFEFSVSGENTVCVYQTVFFLSVSGKNTVWYTQTVFFPETETENSN